jgi:hypothetical protein
MAEQSGAMLIARARKLCIAAKLPYNLWPWLFKAAAY